MDLPEDFQFTNIPNANICAEGRAEMLFGKGWRNNDALEISFADSIIVSDGQSGWSLHTVYRRFPDSYSVSCRKNKLLEDPAPNIPASVGFYRDGNLTHQSHYSGNYSIDPPDGTPSCVDYDPAGKTRASWYTDKEDGSLLSTPSTQKEVDSRIAAARRTTAAKLCAGQDDIIALSAGSLRSNPHRFSRGEPAYSYPV